MATVIETNGQKRSVLPQDTEKGFRFDELNKIVGGKPTILCIKTTAKPKRIMVVIDAIELNDYRINRRATAMYRNARPYPCNGMIYGNVLVADRITQTDESYKIK